MLLCAVYGKADVNDRFEEKRASFNFIVRE